MDPATHCGADQRTRNVATANIQCRKMPLRPRLHLDPAGEAYSWFQGSGEGGKGMEGEWIGEVGREPGGEVYSDAQLEEGHRFSKAGPALIP